MRVLCFASVQANLVDKRDHGICAICGWDMGRLARIVNATSAPDRWSRRRVVDGDTLLWLRNQLGPWGWEIDHIVPVCEGGGVRPDMTVEDVLSNLRTLCPACHKRETAALAARRTERRNGNGQQ